MMKLMYVEDSLAILGGVERVLVDKLNWLVEYGDYEVCLLTANQVDHPLVFSLHPKVMFHDLRIRFHQKYQYSVWKRFHKERKLHRLFQQRLSEKIHEFSPHVIICTRIEYVSDVIKVKGVVPFVFESHNCCRAYQFEKSSWLRKVQFFFHYQSIKKTQMVVSLTHNDAVEWRKLADHVVAIPNVVHLNATGRYSDCQSKSVIFVGRYSYQKDIRTLLKIWRLVHQLHPDWQLHLYGDYGNQQDDLLPEIKRMSINIVVHQPTSAIFEEYLKNSMLLMTSYYEPFGLVLPEAMSCGLPVVAFDCPYGPADIITDGVDGFLIKNRSINDFVEKVCMLMDDVSLRLKMGSEGIKSSQRYEASRVMPQWNNLFRELAQDCL